MLTLEASSSRWRVLSKDGAFPGVHLVQVQTAAIFIVQGGLRALT